jgi:hypothetical protein
MQKKLAPGIYVHNSDQISGYLDVVKNNITVFFNDGKLVSLDSENGQYNSVVDTDIRKVGVFSFSQSYSCHEDDPVNIFKRQIEKIGDEVINSYRGIHNMGDLLKNHEWQIIKYDVGSFFKNHIDDCAAYSRTVSILMYFNDDYDGGEIEFPEFDISYKPQLGDILVFPSSFIYNHSVKEVTSGVRYAAVNWFSYAKLNK